MRLRLSHQSVSKTDSERIWVEKLRFVIGRSKDCDFVVDDYLACRHHCEITFDESDSVMCRDLHSRNGTTVNGKPIEATNLRDGDMIGVGNDTFEVHLPARSCSTYMSRLIKYFGLARQSNSDSGTQVEESDDAPHFGGGA